MSLNQQKLREESQNQSHNWESNNLLERPLLNQDIWQTVNDLKLKINEHKRDLTLNFSEFAPDLFKKMVKLYTLVEAKPGTKAATIRTRLTNLRKFSKFLEQKSIYSPDQITDQLFDEFSYYLRLRGCKERTINTCYTSLVSFFDTCRL